MDQITHEVRLANWKSIIEQCHAGPKGQTAKQWLREHGISEKSYYYWQRKVCQEVYKQAASAILPVVRSDDPVTFAEIPVQQFQEAVPDAHARPEHGAGALTLPYNSLAWKNI